MNPVAAVRRALARMDERSRYVAERRADGLTYDQIGLEIGVTRERVRQLVAKIGRKIRQEQKRQGLEDLL